MNPHPADSSLGWLDSSSNASALASPPYDPSGEGHLIRPRLADRLSAVRIGLEELQTRAQQLARILVGLGCDSSPHHVLWCHALTRLAQRHGDLQGRLNAFERVRAPEDLSPEDAHACVDRFDSDLGDLDAQLVPLETQVSRALAWREADSVSHGAARPDLTAAPLSASPSEINPGARLYAFVLYDALRAGSEWVEVAPPADEPPLESASCEPAPASSPSPIRHLFNQPDLLADIAEAGVRSHPQELSLVGFGSIPVGSMVSVVQTHAGSPEGLREDRHPFCQIRDTIPVTIDLSTINRESLKKPRNFRTIHFVEEFLEDMGKMDETETHPNS